MDFIKEWGMIAGLAGLALGTFLFLFREVIKKKIFPTLTKKQSFSILILFMVLVWLISIISIYLYFSNNSSSMQLTVFVTDTKGNNVLENEGRINIPIGNRSLNEMIGVNGRTNFPEIDSKYKGDTIRIGLDAEGWEIAGKNIFVFLGAPIHINVKRDNSLGIIKGIVLRRNGQKGIDSASVYINSDTTITTDANGNFRIILPEKMRVKKETDTYFLTVSKIGFQTKTQYYHPKSTPAEIRLDKE